MIKVLIVAPHPDDAELAMGGMIVKMISAGWDIVVVDLTDGEPTPFGSREIRARETHEASAILGVRKRICLDIPNRCLQPTIDNRRKLAEIIRLNKPDILFGPAMPDWHPDHKATLDIIEGARFEAKYHKTDMAGEPHWTSSLWLYYSPHRLDYPKPSLVVDITDVWEKKLSAVRAYKSQLKNSLSQEIGLLAKIEITARYFGQCINSGFGEPLLNCRPMRLRNMKLFADF
jgi:bacillithiol biosynthesis deacetylase BshB1